MPIPEAKATAIPSDLDRFATRLEALGFVVLGTLAASKGLPGLQDGRGLALVGNAGPGFWRAFARSAPPSSPTALDDWVRATLDPLAETAGIVRIVYPFDGPPYAPIQTWAVATGTAFPSPLGLLVHRTFGLWHAYRAALVFDRPLDVPNAPPAEASPCDTCAERPCLAACPVTAFSTAGYDVPACTHHLKTIDEGDCLSLGCRARHACPVGRDHVYQPAQAAFHMRAFLAANG